MSTDEMKALIAEARESAPARFEWHLQGSRLIDHLADALEAAQETIAAFIIGGAAHPADDVYQTSIAHPAEEAVAEVVEHLLTMNFDDEPEGFVHRVSGALTQNIVARFALPAPVVTEHTVETMEELDSLPDETVILDRYGDVWQYRGGLWCSYETSPHGSERTFRKFGPLRVIYRPAALTPEGGES